MPRFIGQISLFTFTFEPQGWIFCEGQVLPISEYDALFSHLGTTFGGDGQNTFAVPDLRGKAPDNCRYGISLFGEYEPSSQLLLLGETIISAFAFNKPGILECAGQSLPTARNMYLETLMGTRFGGDGKNNFNLPDLRGKAPANCSYVMAVQGKDPGSDMWEIFVGELLLLPYTVPYSESLKLCNGELLQIEQNRALFTLLGNRFGGDGKQTFALPNLSAAAPSKFNYYIVATKGTFPPRA